MRGWCPSMLEYAKYILTGVHTTDLIHAFGRGMVQYIGRWAGMKVSLTSALSMTP